MLTSRSPYSTINRDAHWLATVDTSMCRSIDSDINWLGIYKHEMGSERYRQGMWARLAERRMT
ncbi:hypothetical protein HGRIS_012157 [Hohenbuehelia grisea]|uniref:Uncharacterized protein n=1 Tax=Hohenbuehelia grisea TaxID=104357 RepID=A0ABR3IRE2_9AGAR